MHIVSGIVEGVDRIERKKPITKKSSNGQAYTEDEISFETHFRLPNLTAQFKYKSKSPIGLNNGDPISVASKNIAGSSDVWGVKNHRTHETYHHGVWHNLMISVMGLMILGIIFFTGADKYAAELHRYAPMASIAIGAILIVAGIYCYKEDRETLSYLEAASKPQ